MIAYLTNSTHHYPYYRANGEVSSTLVDRRATMILTTKHSDTSAEALLQKALEEVCEKALRDYYRSSEKPEVSLTLLLRTPLTGSTSVYDEPEFLVPKTMDKVRALALKSAVNLESIVKRGLIAVRIEFEAMGGYSPTTRANPFWAADQRMLADAYRRKFEELGVNPATCGALRFGRQAIAFTFTQPAVMLTYYAIFRAPTVNVLH